MNSNFNKNFGWQSNYYPQIKSILMENLGKIVNINIADQEQDMKRATDFVITMTGGDVAVRIRRDGYYKFHDFTIRSSKPSGHKTELQKIIDGYGDFYLYCWTVGDDIKKWVLINLEKLRISGILNKPRREIQNTDGSSNFIAIGLDELGDSIIAERDE